MDANLGEGRHGGYPRGIVTKLSETACPGPRGRVRSGLSSGPTASHHCGLGEHPAHLVTEAIHPLAHHFADALGQALLVEVIAGDPTACLVLVDEAGLAQVAEQFGGEEGIPLCLLADRMTEVDTTLVHLVLRKDLHHLDDLDVVESDEVDAHRARLASQTGQGV